MIDEGERELAPKSDMSVVVSKYVIAEKLDSGSTLNTQLYKVEERWISKIVFVALLKLAKKSKVFHDLRQVQEQLCRSILRAQAVNCVNLEVQFFNKHLIDPCC